MSAITAVLIPHKNNNYRPHIIRHYGLVVSLLLILAVQTLGNWQQAHTFKVLGYATSISQGALLSGTNVSRSANGLAPLTTNSALSAAAQSKAQHMIANNYWSHVAPDGTTPWDFIAGAGYSYLKAGENLAYGYATSQATLDAWMASPSHRDNILTAEYEQVGFGIANGSSYQGGENTVVVAMYGDPKTPAPAPTPTPAPTPAPITAVTQPAETASEPIVSAAQPDTVVPKQTQNDDKKKEQNIVPVIVEQISESPALIEQNLSTTSQSVSNFEAILKGDATWPLYITTILLTIIGTIYAYRHLLFVQKVIVHGEYILHAHPLFEASLIYGVIWIVLSAKYGVIQ